MAEQQPIRLARPWIPGRAMAMVHDVIASGNLVQGEQVRHFEAELAQYLRVEHAVLVSSGTAALHLALLSLGIGAGDEVVVPSFTFPATANVVEMVGARAVLADIDIRDCCLDPKKCAEAITERTRAVIPVHALGQPAAMHEILKVAQQRGVAVVEDAACALGAEIDGQKVGTLGRCGCFSFHPRKAITTGEGGLLVADDPELAATWRALRNHGIHASKDRARFLSAGLNYRMTDIQAALGRSQLPEIDRLLAERAAQARRYDRLLGGLPGLRLPPRLEHRVHCHQSYHVILDPELDRDRVIEAMGGDGIETNLGAQALNCLPHLAATLGVGPEDHPNAAYAYSHGLVLPIGPHLDDDAQLRVVDSLARHVQHGS